MIGCSAEQIGREWTSLSNATSKLARQSAISSLQLAHYVFSICAISPYRVKAIFYSRERDRIEGILDVNLNECNMLALIPTVIVLVLDSVDAHVHCLLVHRELIWMEGLFDFLQNELVENVQRCLLHRKRPNATIRFGDTNGSELIEFNNVKDLARFI